MRINALKREQPDDWFRTVIGTDKWKCTNRLPGHVTSRIDVLRWRVERLHRTLSRRHNTHTHSCNVEMFAWNSRTLQQSAITHIRATEQHESEKLINRNVRRLHYCECRLSATLCPSDSIYEFISNRIFGYHLRYDFWCAQVMNTQLWIMQTRSLHCWNRDVSATE